MSIIASITTIVYSYVFFLKTNFISAKFQMRSKAEIMKSWVTKASVNSPD